ncbi:DDE-domain-containing protein [Aulographum hederae CBS 113979]|uniref:DDE-domain-containing protein n=1 Tax=Aulographum hederae CBS 113979 TaxID=1176131 RepID=A0A6G1H741_9PEZI|nr:DDE-domain-containing protein [Aulographum hederae CBS 113979]
MDEKGFLIGVLNKARRVYSSTNKPKGAGQDGNRSWITVIAVICQDGTSLPPSIIYQGMNLQNSWLEDWQPEDQEAWFTATPTGWTNDEVGLSWLTKVFDQSTKKKARNGRDWRLLLIDGHGSHLNIPFIKYALDHKIILAAYPPHSTHRLQPLDVSLFSPLSFYYSQNLNTHLYLTQGLSGITKRDFFRVFWPAYIRAFSERNILSGWRKVGLLPFDPQEVLRQLPKRLDVRKLHGVADSSSRGLINSLLSQAFAGSDITLESRRKISSTIHQLSTQNAILNAEISGLREAIGLEKKKRKRGSADRTTGAAEITCGGEGEKVT